MSEQSPEPTPAPDAPPTDAPADQPTDAPAPDAPTDAPAPDAPPADAPAPDQGDAVPATPADGSAAPDQPAPTDDGAQTTTSNEAEPAQQLSEILVIDVENVDVHSLVRIVNGFLNDLWDWAAANNVEVNLD